MQFDAPSDGKVKLSLYLMYYLQFLSDYFVLIYQPHPCLTNPCLRYAVEEGKGSPEEEEEGKGPSIVPVKELQSEDEYGPVPRLCYSSDEEDDDLEATRIDAPRIRGRIDLPQGKFQICEFCQYNTNQLLMRGHTHESVDRYFFNTNDAMTFLKEDVPNLG